MCDPLTVQRVASPVGGPHVVLLDAGAASEDALRAAARSHAVSRQASHRCRSYRFPYAFVAWHDAPVGVDIERIDAYDARFARSISTPSEVDRLAQAGDPQRRVASLWCSKEAVTKALGDAVHYDPRRLESPMAWPGGRSGRWTALELDAPADHVGWLCWRNAEGRAG